jgi:hypothetical protein
MRCVKPIVAGLLNRFCTYFICWSNAYEGLQLLEIALGIASGACTAGEQAVLS